MAIHAKTQNMIDVAVEVLAANHPMTVRQVYYQLVSRQVIENNRGRYQAVSVALVRARQDGTIPWDWIEDRTRRPRAVGMWSDLSEFLGQVREAYRRDVWADQLEYVECWLEKDALSGIFEDELRPYGVTLNVGRGYDGWDSIRNAADRLQQYYEANGNSPPTILYFGDFDPSGEQMVESLRDRLAFFGVEPEIVKCALTADDIRRYSLPPDPVKKTDTRAAAFIAEHGDISVELDALPVEVLRRRIREEVESRMDMEALADTDKIGDSEQTKLAALIDGWSRD